MGDLNINHGNIDVNAYSDGSELYGKKINPIPAKEKGIGVDTEGILIDNLLNSGISSVLDVSKIESFSQVASDRELVMQVLDTMSEDSTISSALEIYAEDTTEANDSGDIVWCSSDDSAVVKIVTYLLDSMNVNKNIYKWAYSLCKYGDVYLRLYRQSEYEDKKVERKKGLQEKVILKGFDRNDRYSHYVEMVPNPAEMFELTRLGKSCAYIKAGVNSMKRDNNHININSYKYSFNKKDVELYSATDFVHASLEDNSSRVPEEVELFTEDGEEYKTTYTVRRGQSLLYNIYKIWRTMMLLENAMLLNRITKSSVIRIIGVEVGEMPKEQIGPHLMGIKNLMEQKASFDVGSSMSEYTNPGPIENNVYIPTHGGQGNLSIQSLNQDTNVNGLDDIDYFKTKLYSSLRIPKSFLGDTDDAGGFNGGTSLSLQSSRYAKAVKRIQNTLCQMITDAINLMLIDKGLDSYVNKFTIMMQAPSTQEDKDRKEARGTSINLIQDVMNLIDGTDIEDPSSKLRILKSMLSDVVYDSEVISVLQEEIDKLEQQKEEEASSEDMSEEPSGDGFDFSSEGGSSDFDFGDSSLDGTEEFDLGASMETEETGGEENNLPTPGELDIGDLSDMNNENI